MNRNRPVDAALGRGERDIHETWADSGDTLPVVSAAEFYRGRRKPTHDQPITPTPPRVEAPQPDEEEPEMAKTVIEETTEETPVETERETTARRARRRVRKGATLAQLAAKFAAWIQQSELGHDDDMEYPDPDHVRMEIGRRISDARHRAGLSQTVLARAVGYTAANPISKLESGDMVSVDIVTLACIAHVLEVDIDYLVRPAVLAAREVIG